MKLLCSSILYIVLQFFSSMIAVYAISKGKRAIQDLKRADMLALIVQSVGNLPPNFNDNFPTAVNCEINVDSFDSINEANMDFTVSIVVHLTWKDERFRNWAPSDKDDYIEFDSKKMEKLWVPDLYFPNEKKAFFHDVFMPNKMLRLYADCEVSYSARLSLTLSCPMNLRNYPFDIQICSIEVESFSYNEGNIVLNWVGDLDNSTDKVKSVDINAEVELPQFEVFDIRTKSSHRHRKGSGDHTVLTADFYLERNIGYYVVQMYIPSVLVVMLSWISFWLNVNAVPGRISLGVLTVLTMTTQSSGVNASLPRVSYTKAIDIWMSVCLLFVFAALIEFAIANVLSRKDNNKGLKLKNVFYILRPDSKKEKSKTESITNSLIKSTMFIPSLHSAKILVGDDGEMRLDPESDPTIAAERKRISGIVYAMYLDVASRFLFPFFFALFNVVYWSYYLNASS